MKLVLISDTHDLQHKVSIPDGDVFVHAGDLTMIGDVESTQKAIDWLDGQPHEHVVFIAGNHDYAFERGSRLDLKRLAYLENSSVTIHGVKFYGSPVQPWFMSWAFNVHRGKPIKQFWDKIPEDTDVLITHGPPWGVLDQSIPGKTDHLGCEELAKRMDAIKPKVHVWGHIHGSHGKVSLGDCSSYNASVVNEAYKVVNEPFVVEI